MFRVNDRTRRLLSYLICLLFLICSVDRVPDPPSIKPQHRPALSLQSAADHRLPGAGLDLVTGPVPLKSPTWPELVFWTAVAADQSPARLSVYLTLASDSSPPARPTA